MTKNSRKDEDMFAEKNNTAGGYVDPWAHIPHDGHTYYLIREGDFIIPTLREQMIQEISDKLAEAKKVMKKVSRMVAGPIRKQGYKVDFDLTVKRSTTFKFKIIMKGDTRPSTDYWARKSHYMKLYLSIRDQLPEEHKKVWNLHYGGFMDLNNPVLLVEAKPWRNTKEGKAVADDLSAVFISPKATKGRRYYMASETTIPNISDFWARYVRPVLKDPSLQEQINTAGHEFIKRNSRTFLVDLTSIQLFRPDSDGPWYLAQHQMTNKGIAVDLSKHIPGLKRLKMSQYWAHRERFAHEQKLGERGA